MLLKSRHGRQLSRGALAMALAAATSVLVAGPALAKDKKAEAAAPAGPKITPTKTFVPTIMALGKAIDEAKKRADVIAAQQNLTAATNTYNSATGSAARKAAAAQRQEALNALSATLAAEKTQADSALAAAPGPDDKFFIGQYTAQLGVVAQDMGLVRKGYEIMLGTGKYPAADTPKLQNAIGSICYDQKDWACVQTNLTAALAGGFKGDNTEVVLADSFIQQGQVATGLQKLMDGIKAHNAAGTPAPQDWYRRGLSAAYKAKLLDQAGNFANALVEAYPTTDNWAGAISVLRLVAKYEVQERLDLMRLMQRTHSFTEGTDYAEFIQAADPRRLPAEVLPAIDEGLKAGKLDANDVFVTDARAQAAARVKEEQPTLPALEKSASAPSATGVMIAATADAFLSYGQPAKAEAMYNAALAKGGADVQRVMTRIGIAQFDQGKYADAKATFDKVTGIRQPLAQLWSIYSAQKAKGG